MAKREKILFTLMIAAIGYGIFEFFSWYLAQDRIVEQPTPQLEDALGFSAAAGQAVEDARLMPTEIYIIDLATRKPVRDILYEWPPDAMETEQEPFPDEAVYPMLYNGYLEMGDRRLAIIDGIEYEEGDTLARGFFKVLSISPHEIIIESLGNDRRIAIPYAEEF